MTEAPDASSASEPSMEEILASIRKIIADEKDPAAPAETAAQADDVLELTQMVQDDGSVVDLSAAVETPVEPVIEAPVQEIPPMPEQVAAPKAPSPDTLISERAAKAATSSLASLANTVQIERMASMPNMTPIGNGSRTLEDMIIELMRPLLKAWLDQNLPSVVDRLVQKEVERISHRLQE